jgi:chromosomal replication initiation ATPase DnaA
MTKRKSRRKEYMPTAIEQARDELFSHILRCGVLEAADEQRTEWFNDTMEYLAERYEDLTPVQVTELRTLGERYCQPVVARKEGVEAGVA